MDYLWITFFCNAFFHAVLSQGNITLYTNKGPIVGLRFNPSPETGVSYDAFIGIPYGKVPARFQLAQPPDSWTQPLPTQTDGACCPQPENPYNSGTPPSEDCLFINVFRPINSPDPAQKFPIMAFIHGSAFTYTSSNSKVYGPDFLTNASVILVTFNYRLGAVGFLSLGCKEAPGNLGLHDTWLALQWIQDEISNFGGDPSQVTLFGQSAGSVMSQYHYLSDFTSGLFARVISQSGAALAHWGLLTSAEATRRARLLAASVGCDTSQPDSAILTCLQKADIKDIVGNQSISLSIMDQANGNIWPFLPVMDNDQTAEKPFFNDSISNLMKRALTRNKPFLTGYTTDEGILKFYEDSWKLAESNLVAFTPRTLNDNSRGELVDSIRGRYFPDTVDENKVEGIIRIYTDYMFAYPSVQVTKYFSNLTYGYLFAYEGPWSPPAAYFTKYKVKGVMHGDELSYLFYHYGLYLDNCTLNAPNLKMKDQMVRWWTTFAKYGVPDASWPKISDGGYLVIDTSLTLMNTSTLESQYYNFWASIDSSGNSSSTNSVANTRITLMNCLFTICCGILMRMII